MAVRAIEESSAARASSGEKQTVLGCCDVPFGANKSRACGRV